VCRGTLLGPTRGALPWSHRPQERIPPMQFQNAPSQNQSVYWIDGQGVRAAYVGIFPKLAKKVILIDENFLCKSLV
jgi:hypothetical protein